MHAQPAPSCRMNYLSAAYVVLYRSAGGATMLFTIAVILLVLWLLGLVSGYTLGNFIYVLLGIALVRFVLGLPAGRRTVGRCPDRPPGSGGAATKTRRGS